MPGRYGLDAKMGQQGRSNIRLAGKAVEVVVARIVRIGDGAGKLLVGGFVECDKRGFLAQGLGAMITPIGQAPAMISCHQY